MHNGHIAIHLPNLQGGGAERLHVNLANDWVKRGYKVDLVLMQERGDLLPLVSPDVTLVNLGVDRIRHAIRAFASYLRRSSPDVTLTAMWPLTSASVIAWLISGRPGRLFLSDHVMLSISAVRELGISLGFLKALMRITYPLVTGIIGVSEGVKNDICRLGNLSENRVEVIYNPAATGASPGQESAQTRRDLWGTGSAFNVLSVGALKEQKDHETLIRAFARIPDETDIRLSIVGDGPLRGKLEHLIVALGQQSRIELPGFFIDPSPWFRTADLFVLSSQWEGFGNVLVEALESGLPVISTNCASGPAEILENGRYGQLIPPGDPGAMSAAIISSIGQLRNREQLMRRAKEFSVPTISTRYLQLFFEKGQ